MRHTYRIDFVDLAVVRFVASVFFVVRDFLGCGATIVLYEGERERDRGLGLWVGGRN